jgi:hypothetical protein
LWRTRCYEHEVLYAVAHSRHSKRLSFQIARSPLQALHYVRDLLCTRQNNLKIRRVTNGSLQLSEASCAEIAVATEKTSDSSLQQLSCALFQEYGDISLHHAVDVISSAS